jgi:small-conductance mechanosensitive channel
MPPRGGGQRIAARGGGATARGGRLGGLSSALDAPPRGCPRRRTANNVEGRVRVDFTVGIGYEADIDQAKSVLLALVKDDKRVLAEPAPMVAVAELGDSSVNLALRVHCNPDDYWGIYFDGLEAIKKTLDKHNISIPFPQRDVHLHQKSA